VVYVQSLDEETKDVRKKSLLKVKWEAYDTETASPMIATLIGALAGYVLVHPYTMLIYAWAHEHQLIEGRIIG